MAASGQNVPIKQITLSVSVDVEHLLTSLPLPPTDDEGLRRVYDLETGRVTTLRRRRIGRGSGGSSAVDGAMFSAPDLRQLGARLRAVRKEAGRTQHQVAVAVGLTRTYLSEIETGRKNITVHTLCALAQHFGIDPADLLRVQTRSPDC